MTTVHLPLTRREREVVNLLYCIVTTLYFTNTSSLALMDTSNLELEHAVSGDQDMDPLQVATVNLEHSAAITPSVTPEDLGRAGKPTARQTPLDARSHGKVRPRSGTPAASDRPSCMAYRDGAGMIRIGEEIAVHYSSQAL